MKKKFVTIGLINPKNTANVGSVNEGGRMLPSGSGVVFRSNATIVLLKCLRTQKT